MTPFLPTVGCGLWMLVTGGLILVSGLPAQAQHPSARIDSAPDLTGGTGQPLGPDSTLHDAAPAFPGGEAALMHFIRERLRYPSLAARNRIEGKVIVSFWLDERGRPYGFGVLKGLGAGLDEEAIRILKEMPDWAPAIVSGRPTLTQMRIPVVFRVSQ